MLALNFFFVPLQRQHPPFSTQELELLLEERRLELPGLLLQFPISADGSWPTEHPEGIVESEDATFLRDAVVEQLVTKCEIRFGVGLSWGCLQKR